MRIQTGLFILTGFLLVGAIHAQQVEFNYEGRVMVDGMPFDGPGHFKFAIVNPEGTLSLWSNDATSTTGEEPSRAVIVDVTEGVFNVMIGDASGTGMESLDASLFNVDERVSLRVWFSDIGSAGSFEELKPDRAIANPGLLGSKSYKEIHLYVDPALGNDDYPGLKPQRPKRSIQAAWNALPPLIERDATIHLADGVYREEVLLTGKTAVGDATIALSGNLASPTSVRITGADAGAETTPVRYYCFKIIEQKNVTIQGVSIDYTRSDWDGKDPVFQPRGGIFMMEDSTLSLQNSIVRHHSLGLFAYMRCEVEVVDCEFSHGEGTYARLLWTNEMCFLRLADSVFHDSHFGVCVSRLSAADIAGSTISAMTGTGCKADFLSNLTFKIPINAVQGCADKGVAAGHNCVVSYSMSPAYVSYSDNGVDHEFTNGTVTYDP